MPTPDVAEEEALELIVRLAGRVRVARSFARIASGMLQESAQRASEALRAYADEAVSELAPPELRRVARAAAEAAVRVTTSRIAHGARPEKKREDPPGPARSEEEPSGSLDHEALHDDPC